MRGARDSEASPGRCEVVELVQGASYRLGGRVQRDGRVSWAPPDGGYEPISCYLLLEGDRALLVDTGVAVHEELVLAQLASLLPAHATLSIFLTRAELDCLGNLAAIAATFPLASVVTGGVVNPFDTFDHATSLMPETVPFTRGADVSHVPVGEGRRLVVLRPPLRLLATFWGYDERTATLFTSDAFGHVGAPGASDPAVVDEMDDAVDPALVGAHLAAKFEWLAASPRVGEVARALACLLESLRPRVIAPTHGCVIRGEAAVRAHVEALFSVLRAYERAEGSVA